MNNRKLVNGMFINSLEIEINFLKSNENLNIINSEGFVDGAQG